MRQRIFAGILAASLLCVSLFTPTADAQRRGWGGWRGGYYAPSYSYGSGYYSPYNSGYYSTPYYSNYYNPGYNNYYTPGWSNNNYYYPSYGGYTNYPSYNSYYYNPGTTITTPWGTFGY